MYLIRPEYPTAGKKLLYLCGVLDRMTELLRLSALALLRKVVGSIPVWVKIENSNEQTKLKFTKVIKTFFNDDICTHTNFPASGVETPRRRFGEMHDGTLPHLLNIELVLKAGLKALFTTINPLRTRVIAALQMTLQYIQGRFNNYTARSLYRILVTETSLITSDENGKYCA